MSSYPLTSLNLLANWWWGGEECYVWTGIITGGSNLTFGSNPPYQLSDFLAMYPKFGVQPQALQAVQPNVVPGAGYAVNDLLVPVQSGAVGGVIKVLAVLSGAPTAYSVSIPGQGYSVAKALVTTGGTGAGALVDVLAISAYSGVVPPAVVQAYINLATASLDVARWFDSWQLAMGLFVAHYVTLYLRSEGNPGTTAGQIAVSGLEKGIATSKSAGDVSVGITLPQTEIEWGTFAETTYGNQLITMARGIGAGPMYVW